MVKRFFLMSCFVLFGSLGAGSAMPSLLADAVKQHPEQLIAVYEGKNKGIDSSVTWLWQQATEEMSNAQKLDLIKVVLVHIENQVASEKKVADAIGAAAKKITIALVACAVIGAGVYCYWQYRSEDKIIGGLLRQKASFNKSDGDMFLDVDGDIRYGKGRAIPRH